ncbi:uncharacterized protein BO97DRAFT_390445 [Aspergillus homomorphus CBS 101889]|uniref:Uncharacterized protein n=1 Tax=Aspergillus homomorphus (strain CBS 101889) TaxID=1450537 RepID=A0A395HWM0_ASPHC|nr:hypothetical protein BO97DRAFT_390445 [Aspergillus homomorphus CBS 101889]RAL12197.1 hypothetical protein BO97DRAFT_390445 [Aspergillus homomorphus CBS 101889]
MSPGTRLLYLLTPPALLTYTVHRGLTHLEAKYPAVPPEQASSRALTTPENPATQRCAEIDIYQARVPVEGLLRAAAAAAAAATNNNPNTSNTNLSPTINTQTLQTAWAILFLTSPIIQTEAKLIGLLTTGKFHPGDVGLSPAGFQPPEPSPDNPAPTKRKLINGGFIVERQPTESPYGLLASWKIPNEPREFFERIAQWGYPWRLMSGGRHEWSVSEPYLVDESEGAADGTKEREWVVDVRFASAHDYEVVEAEGERQKVIPGWGGRLHRGFAMLLVEDTVRRVK